MGKVSIVGETIERIMIGLHKRLITQQTGRMPHQDISKRALIKERRPSHLVKLSNDSKLLCSSRFHYWQEYSLRRFFTKSLRKKSSFYSIAAMSRKTQLDDKRWFLWVCRHQKLISQEKTVRVNVNCRISTRFYQSQQKWFSLERDPSSSDRKGEKH